MSPARVPYKSSTLGVFWAFGVFLGLYKKNQLSDFLCFWSFLWAVKKSNFFRLWGFRIFFRFVKKLNCRPFFAFAAHKEGSLISIVFDTRVNSWNLWAHTQKRVTYSTWIRDLKFPR